MNPPTLSPHTAIETGIELFLASLAEAGPFGRSPLSPGTRRAYGVDLDQFARFLHTRVTAPTVANVPAEAVAAFARHLTDARRSPRTVARKLAAVRGLFRFLRSRAYAPPTPPWRSGPPPRPRIRLPHPRRDARPAGPSRARLLHRRQEPGPAGADLRRRPAALGSGEPEPEPPRPVRWPAAHHRRQPPRRALGPQAAEALQAYLLSRAEVLLTREISSVDAGALFVSARGRRLHPRSIQRIVDRYLRHLEAPPGPTREGPPRHRGTGQLRAACARHLVEAGADPGLVSALLDLRTAASDPDRGRDISELTARYRQAHPRA